LRSAPVDVAAVSDVEDHDLSLRLVDFVETL